MCIHRLRKGIRYSKQKSFVEKTDKGKNELKDDTGD